MTIVYTRRMSTRVNPIRLFVTHAWLENDDYTRIFEYLEASGTFYYLNTSQPQAKRPIDKESQREDLRRQIAPSEVIIVLPAVYQIAPELILFEMNFAKAADKPIVAMENFGSTEPLPKAIKDLADEVSAWNERNLIDSLRRQARHQETKRWDTIEFKLDYVGRRPSLSTTCATHASHGWPWMATPGLRAAGTAKRNVRRRPEG